MRATMGKLRGAIVLLIALTPRVPAPALQEAERTQTLAWLAARRDPAGGYAADAAADTLPTLPATSAALRALRLFGGKIDGTIATETFIKSCATPEGLALRPGGAADVRTTAVGIMAFLELKAPSRLSVAQINQLLGGAVEAMYARAKTFDDIRIAAAAIEALDDRSSDHQARRRAWLGLVTDLRQTMAKTKSGQDARLVASVAVTIMRLGGKVDDAAAVVRLITQQQQKTGGWGQAATADPDLESTYRVVRCLVMLHGRPDVAALRRFVTSCRNADGGYGVSPRQPSTVSATYYAGSILAWLEKFGS